LTQKNQKVKAVHPSLENYTSFHYPHPNSQTPLTDSFAKNPMVELIQGFGDVPFSLFSYAMYVRPIELAKARAIVDLHGKKHKPGDETPAA
jgi:hypothetical protein